MKAVGDQFARQPILYQRVLGEAGFAEKATLGGVRHRVEEVSDFGESVGDTCADRLLSCLAVTGAHDDACASAVLDQLPGVRQLRRNGHLCDAGGVVDEPCDIGVRRRTEKFRILRACFGRSEMRPLQMDRENRAGDAP